MLKKALSEKDKGKKLLDTFEEKMSDMRAEKVQALQHAHVRTQGGRRFEE